MLDLEPLLTLHESSAVERRENQAEAYSAEDQPEKQQEPERCFARIRMRHSECLRNHEQSAERKRQSKQTEYKLAEFAGDVHPDHCPREEVGQ
jgi:hypothetical protein